jgi:S1-C subfamily serine protease
MRRLLVPLVSALLGGAVAAGVVVAVDDDDAGATRAATSVQQAPLDAAQNGGSSAALTPAQIYERDAPGVVFIRAEVVTQAAPSIFDLSPSEQRGISTGTGFVIDEDGSIVTNAHVVRNARRVSVQFASEDTKRAEIVGQDLSTDIALLRVKPDGVRLVPLALGASKDLKVGDPTVAIGNPFGLERTLTTGVISALSRKITAPNNFDIENVIQTDAALNPGNSGGPLIDGFGRVIGINSAIRTNDPEGTGGNIGIGFAVPIDTAKRVVPDLRKKGRVDRPYLGVSTITVDESLRALGLDVGRGALVQAVAPGSPADRAGIRAGDVQAQIGGQPLVLGGDVLLEVDGERIETSEDVAAAISDNNVGDKVKVVYQRDGDERTVDVELARRPNQALTG